MHANKPSQQTICILKAVSQCDLKKPLIFDELRKSTQFLLNIFLIAPHCPQDKNKHALDPSL